VLLAMERWGQLAEPGRLFLNISADVLQQVLKQRGCDGLVRLAQAYGVSPRMLCWRSTEYERVADMDSRWPVPCRIFAQRGVSGAG